MAHTDVDGKRLLQLLELCPLFDAKMVWLNGSPRSHMDWDRFDEAVEQIATPSSGLSAAQPLGTANRCPPHHGNDDRTYAGMHAKSTSKSVAGNARPKWLKQSDSIPFSGAHRHRRSPPQKPSDDSHAALSNQRQRSASVCKVNVHDDCQTNHNGVDSAYVGSGFRAAKKMRRASRSMSSLR